MLAVACLASRAPFAAAAAAAAAAGLVFRDFAKQN